MALNVVSSDRLSTNVKTSNLATGLSSKVGESKNIIINGAMNVAQRQTSTTTNNDFPVDRFRGGFSGTDEAPTFAQHALTSSDTGPWAKGFRNSVHVTNGNQTGGAGTSDKVEFYTRLEAQDIANSGWDYTSTSSYITLSFWVKSSVAQNFYGYIINLDGTIKNYPFETGALSANTWTKITKTLPGHADLSFNNDSGEGLRIVILPFLGTDQTGSVSTGSWSTYNSATRTPNNTSTWYTTNDATFEFTGVQLEVGDTATEFEHRSYGDELRRCQRYCYVDRGSDDYHAVAQGHYNGATAAIFMIFTPVAMRAAPTVSTPTGTWICSGDAGGLSTSNIVGTDNIAETNAFQIRATVSGAESGEGFLFRTSSAGHSFILDSEL